MAFPSEGSLTQWLDEAIAEATALLMLLEEMRRLAGEQGDATAQIEGLRKLWKDEANG
jgi:hypothetical protein